MTPVNASRRARRPLLRRVPGRQVDRSGQRPADGRDERLVLLGEGRHLRRVHLEQADPGAAPLDRHAEPGMDRFRRLRPGDLRAGRAQVVDPDRLERLHDVPAARRATDESLAQGLVLESAGRGADHQVVAIDEGDRAAGERHDPVQSIERGAEDRVELPLPARGRRDLEDELRRGQRPGRGGRRLVLRPRSSAAFVSAMRRMLADGDGPGPVPAGQPPRRRFRRRTGPACWASASADGSGAAGTWGSSVCDSRPDRMIRRSSASMAGSVSSGR